MPGISILFTIRFVIYDLIDNRQNHIMTILSMIN